MSSGYLSRVRTVVQGGVWSRLGKEGGFQSSFEALIGQEKFWFYGYKRFHSLSATSFAYVELLLRPATSSESLVVTRRRDIPAVGALSRAFSIPFVSGPSFQICGYHLDRSLCDSGQVTTSEKAQSKPMAASSARVVFGECFLENLGSRDGNLLNPTNGASISCGNRSTRSCRRASMSLRNNEQSTNSTLNGFFVYNVVKSCSGFSPFMEAVRDFYSSAGVSFSARAAPDVTYENSPGEKPSDGSAASLEQKASSGKALKLVSGSCSLPHPDKEETGGEDAHFICEDEQTIGVADGVGGWADLGVDAGKYSRELMSNAVKALKEEPKGSADPARVLEKAYQKTKAKGSSTACIVALTEEGLHAINLGDSGFIVVRDGCTVFRSSPQQHDFNFTFQLENGSNGDPPSSGQIIRVPVAPGDVIVAGTDGLFDNLYNNEITAVVVHATRAGLEPQEAAQKIAALARQRAQDRNRQTPFSTAAQDAGFRYYGGKLDDITVVVSYITCNDKEQQESSA